MQPGGFGGQGPGQPPGGYPPGGYPPGGAPPYGANPQAPQGAPQYQGAPAQQQYGAPAQQYGAPPAQQQYPGAPAQQYGAPPAQQQYPGAPAQQYGAPPAQQQYPGAMPGAYPGMNPMAAMGAAPQNSFGQAQSALSGAGNMMKLMKYGFIGIGALCILGGLVLLVFDPMTGIMVAVTGAVFIGVALAVLPQFSGMLGQATAMVDSFAAKEQLAQTGIPAQGRLISVQQTGRLVNYNPEIHAVVEVTHPQLGVYQTQTTAIVPQIAIPRAQPGAPVQLRVSPQNQHEIALIF